jgi:hypothetical protein
MTVVAFKPIGDKSPWWEESGSMGYRRDGSSLMMDAEALGRLEQFVIGHGLCEDESLSTEFVEDRDTGGIQVIKRCQACNALVLATVTRGAAKALLR